MSDFIKQMVDDVRLYESDTFSASGSEITEEQAKGIVEILLKGWWENRLDGVVITEAYQELLDKEICHELACERAMEYECRTCKKSFCGAHCYLIFPLVSDVVECKKCFDVKDFVNMKLKCATPGCEWSDTLRIPKDAELGSYMCGHAHIGLQGNE